MGMSVEGSVDGWRNDTCIGARDRRNGDLRAWGDALEGEYAALLLILLYGIAARERLGRSG